MNQRRLPTDVRNTVFLLAAYFVAGKLGLRLAFENPSATPVWPATGLALFAFLVLGKRAWPAILLGAFLVNITTAGTVATSIGIAIGNTLEGVVGAWLVTRFAGGRDFLMHPESVFKFTLLAALLSTAVSATIGVTSLLAGGLLPVGAVAPTWLTWWLGDASGNLIVAPALLAWYMPAPSLRRRGVGFETLALYASLVLAGLFVFGGLLGIVERGAPIAFVCIPFLIWAAFRLGRREAATAVIVLGAVAIWGTVRGDGAFVRTTPNESLLLLQAYMGMASVMTLMVAAAVSERITAEQRLRDLSTSDPLTGLANYRELIARLESEIGRSQRNGRIFAVVFIDVDGLKQINDRHGHMIGSRALCRVAEVLRLSARAIDIPARYGGDEFALVLPDAEEADAWQAGRRIAERLAADTETPVVRVSLGVAVHPKDGATPEALLGAADHRLYQERSQADAPR